MPGYAAALIAVIAQGASAQRATQTVTFRVEAINQIAVQGAPDLTIESPAAGSQSTVTTTAGTWSVTTNQSDTRITASLASAMPNGLTLSLSLAAPRGATSAGMQVLGTEPVELVSHLTRVAAAGLPLSYELAAMPTGETIAGQRVVIFTITDAP